MKLLRGIVAGFMLACPSIAFAQTNPGSSPLTIAKGGTGGATASAARSSLGVPIYTAGSWTPTVTTSGTVGTPAYSIQVGTYEQIGRQVTVRFSLTLTSWAGSPTGNVSIAGLPFTSANIGNDNGSCHFGSYVMTGTNLTASNVLSGTINFNTAVVQLLQVGNTTGAVVTQAQVGLAPTFIGWCQYHT